MSSAQDAQGDVPIGWRMRAVDYFGLERNVVIASTAVFLLGLGKELWKKFLPKYLEALGAIGGLLWKVAPQVPFITAGVIGIIGTFVFAVTVEERYAS